jgi:hypothetical protein
MTEEDLNKIEAALNIRLPADYRKFMNPYPIPALEGSYEGELWSNAEKLIEFNTQLRTKYYSVDPWPPHLFALGLDGTGCTCLIDTTREKCTIAWADRCHLSSLGEYPFEKGQEFKVWANTVVDGEKEYLLDAGHEPNMPATEYQALCIEEGKRHTRGCLIIGAILIVIMVVLYIMGRK